MCFKRYKRKVQFQFIYQDEKQIPVPKRQMGKLSFKKSIRTDFRCNINCENLGIFFSFLNQKLHCIFFLHYRYRGIDNFPATMTLVRRGHYASLCGSGQSGSKIMRVDGTVMSCLSLQLS